MCMNVRMDGLNKSDSHATGHRNQSEGLIGSDWALLCRKDGKLTRGKCPVGEKWQYDENGGGECRGKDFAIRGTLRNDRCDVGQQINQDSSHPCHEFQSYSKSVGGITYDTWQSLHSQLFCSRVRILLLCKLLARVLELFNVLLLLRLVQNHRSILQKPCTNSTRSCTTGNPTYKEAWTVHVEGGKSKWGRPEHHSPMQNI